MIRLTLDSQTVNIDKGELVSYKVDDHEYIHQKGSPGWRNSDTEMFPIIGPTAEAAYKVITPEGIAIQDQHGLLRELGYVVAHQSVDKVVFEKEYTSNARVKNSKFPDKSAVAELYWPYDFKFHKTFHLKKDGLYISFKIEGGHGMPFMLGYHPAFKINGENAIVEASSSNITIPEIIEVGSMAMEISNCESVTLKDTKDLTIKTQGFGNFMFWTEVGNMVCIEPITFYPYTVSQNDLHQGFTHLSKGPKNYMVQLRPTFNK